MIIAYRGGSCLEKKDDYRHRRRESGRVYRFGKSLDFCIGIGKIVAGKKERRLQAPSGVLDGWMSSKEYNGRRLSDHAARRTTILGFLLHALFGKAERLRLSLVAVVLQFVVVAVPGSRQGYSVLSPFKSDRFIRARASIGL